MVDREAMNKYMAKRRARLKEEGICVDCQTAKVSPPQQVSGHMSAAMPAWKRAGAAGGPIARLCHFPSRDRS
jgi:hypothetical protein